MGRRVKFIVSTGFVGADKQETFELEEIGIIESKYEKEEDLLKDIEQAYDDWMHENIEACWDFED